MSRIDQLLERYRTHISQPLRNGLPLSQRIWFVVHDPEDERRLRSRLSEFEISTRDTGLGWTTLSLDGTYARWLESFEDEEREQVVMDPELTVTYAETGFQDFLCERIQAWIETVSSDLAPRTVFALTGLMELYDFLHVSAILDALDTRFPGVLLVFFPGEREGNRYKFLGVREGWDYLAVPILPEA